MTSSMLVGERRWAPSRRGGMTVLGKVPKPLNLPSQRLENHGLDPNKGTLSWGSRPSSSASSAWGSSTLSPNSDGGSRSPSQLSGRPSSGSGTRPSTAGSDRMHEHTLNAWGQSSRPSSASGALTSNQTALTSLRPRSAETRPGSSQLSRFAESSSDTSLAWGPTGVSAKSGVASSKNDEFSLSCGDFPTLGSEREISGKSNESQDRSSYSRPGSSSGRAGWGKERSITSLDGDISVSASVKSGTVNTWRRDGSQSVEDGVHPSVEKWQGNPPPYLYANVPPQHFDAWHGPPKNPPPGVWYRGPPGGPPYGHPLAHGGFPIEPFPYYHPQIPPTALANSQHVPPSGTAPRGHHPKNGDLRGPQIPDAYIRPDMPIRPGFYPGPMAYEGYYGPPMRYCNSNERGNLFMAMPAAPSAYNRYPCENDPNPGNNYARASVHGSEEKTSVSDQVETGHSDDTRGPYKVLLKQHNGWDEKQKEDKWERVVPANDPYVEKGDQSRNSLRKHEWGLEDGDDEENYSGRTFGGDGHSLKFDNQGICSSDSVDNSSVNKSANVVSTSQVPQFSKPQVFPASPRDPKLVQKIEGLHAKARVSDGWADAAPIPCREEQKSSLQFVDAMTNCSANEAGTGAVCFERTHTSGILISSSHEVNSSMKDKTLQPAASTISRRASHSTRGRLDHHGQRLNTPDADGWRKKSLAAESVSEGSSFNVNVRDQLPSVEGAEKSGINLQGKDEGESLTPMFDASDSQEQMREIAKQRAKQLQEEEEERTREQKAKALAKLEELNHRMQTMDGSSQKLETSASCGPIQQEQEDSGIPVEPSIVASSSRTRSSQLVSYPNAKSSENSTIGVEESNVLSEDTILATTDHVHPKSVVSHGQPLPLQQDALTASAAECEVTPQVNEGSVSRHKRIGYKRKQNAPLGMNLTERSAPIGPTEARKDQTDVVVNDVASAEVVAGEVGPSSESSLPLNSNIMAESLAHQRRKNSRSSKNKQKLDGTSSIAAFPLTVSKESNASRASTEAAKPKDSELELDPSSVPSSAVAKRAIQSNEEAGGRVRNQWKSQHSRRMQRIGEKLYISDPVIWAPVRSQEKAEAKSENSVQNNVKSKRAEMERYVPKPVADELAQQGSIQQPELPSVNQTTLDDSLGRADFIEIVASSQPGDSATGNIGSTAADSRNGDGKQTKQSKTKGSWRQRGLVESTVQGSQEGSSSSSNARKNAHKSIEHCQSSKPDTNSLKEQTKFYDDWNTSDGWNAPDDSETAVPVTSALVKDQGVTGRGKRHPFKDHGSTGSNNDLDHRSSNGRDNDKTSRQPLAPEMGQTDKKIASKENRGVGEQATSLWKPKSQVHSVSNKLGNRTGGGQNDTVEVRNAIKKHSSSEDRASLRPRQNEESREKMVHPPSDRSVSEQKNVAQAPNVGHQESKRGRKVDSFSGRPHSPNPSSVNSVELAPPASVDTQHEQHFSSGFRKNVNQNNLSGRGHESRGGWSSAGQGNRQHNTTSNRGRERHNSHYAYQPIGRNNKTNNFEGSTDGSHNMGSRYRERSQGGRESGTVAVDAICD